MITGAHSVLFTQDAEADRAFFRDVLGLANVDAGDGWLIFALPPAELSFHPAADQGGHETYLLCDDIHAFVTKMTELGVKTGGIAQESWGQMTNITLPSGSLLGVYQPTHIRPQ